MSNYVEFKRIEKQDRDIRVYRDVWVDKRGASHEILSVRQFYLDQDSGEWRPGKGVTFKDEDVDDIIQGLQAMNEWLAEDRAVGGKRGKES